MKYEGLISNFLWKLSENASAFVNPAIFANSLISFSKNIIGKPVGIDIKEQKMTLPLIHTLKTANEADRKYYFNTIRRYNNDQKRVKELIEFVKKSGGLDYAIGVMKDFQQKAKNILAEFPDSDAKHSLNLMLDYVIERKF